ncbi:NLR family CARD domain-containing protein 4 [Pseudonaja textilis]|uniref:NLR family CARD domain-containing protein 4 n=1 Tax=Pseudonaja textilis TaxID=8673 RepID=UPI000EAA8A9B|nr:NLR family CARD domain-containing protein 4 [Pseudonaja textilis]XP_026551307.1 NLR family CARD domain-containing protein 4 [Pseudonaja textilis]
MDFLENNHEQLIQRMEMATVKKIVDCLFAKSVLSNEEKDSILCQKVRQDASRKLICSILEKGDKACGILVRSLEKIDFFLFKKLQGSHTDGQVRQQDVNYLAQDLTNLYRHKSFERFHPLGEEIDIIFDLKNTYTDILLWKKDIHNSRLAQMTLNALLDELESPCIIEGEAGKGKTTLLKKIALLWANEDHPSLMRFKLVFFISLSGVEAGLYETICEQLLRKNYRICKEDFMEILELLEEKVLFLLDGYDEFKSQSCPEIEALIKESHRFKNTVIVTTRTESIRSLRLFGSLIAETGDLTVESAKTLVKNVLEEATIAEGLLSQLESLDSTFQNSGTQLENLMRTPLFVIIACAIQMGESTFTPHTQTTLFSTLYNLLVGKNKYKTRKISDKHFRLSLIHCGNLALDGIFEQKFVFYSEDVPSEEKENVLLSIGLMHKYTAQRLKVAYTFFHKSFQEYIAGRRLSRLLRSHSDEEVTRGLSYLKRIKSFSAIITTHHSLLLYTCGSSSEATKKVISYLSTIHQGGSLFGLPSVCDLVPEELKKYEQIAAAEEEEGLIATRENSFVECAIRFLYESISEITVKEEFEEFFYDKKLYINTQSIPTYVSGFFDYFSNCVSMLEVIKLDFFGTSSATRTPWKSVIPEKAVSLFFNWNRKLRGLEITLKDFNQLEKGDVKYLEKICCSAARLRLIINKCPGLTGKLREVLNSCTNLQDLIVESTPLSIEDEQQITQMMVLKTIKVKDLQSENQHGGLLDAISILANVEKITFDNVKMNENTADRLAEGLKNLKKLNSLQLKELTNVGDGMISIVKSISYLQELEEIYLVNCCISATAVKILVQNICSLPKLSALDLSNNFLGNGGKEALCRLVESLNVLPKMKILMFPWVDEVSVCLVKLEELKKMPQLTKLGLKKWRTTNSEARILSSLLAKAPLADLQHLDMAETSLTSEGWLTILKALTHLKKLTFLDFSQEQGFTPSALLVLALARLINQLVSLQEIDLTGWQFDTHELQEINKAKESHRNELHVIVSSIKPLLDTTI